MDNNKSNNANSRFEYQLCAGVRELAKGQTFHHPVVIARHAWEHVSLRQQKLFNHRDGRSPRDQHFYQDGLVKNFVLDQAMSPMAKSWYAGLTPAQKALPLQRSRWYERDTLIDLFVRDFHIEELEEHYKAQLHNMELEQLPDKAPLKDPQKRLFAIQQIYATIPTLKRDNYLNAYFGPLPRKHVLVNQLSLLAADKKTWPQFFEAAKSYLHSGPELALSRNEHARVDTEGEDTRDERPKVKFNVPSKETHPRFNFDNNKRRRDFYNNSKVSSIQQDGEDEDTDPNESLYDNLSSEMQRISQQVEGFDKKLESAVNAVKATMSDNSNSLGSSGNINQVQMSELLNTVNSMVNAMANMNNQGRGGGGSRPNKRSRLNSAVPPSESTESTDRYYYNPKGGEDWMRWFRICAKCGKWCAHFAKYCKEPQRTDFNRNEDPRSVKPVNTYPKNLQAAMALAHAEFNKYGSRCRWNCKDANGPVINPE